LLETRIGKNGGRLFRRLKLTLSCSAEGKEGRKEGKMMYTRVFRKLNLFPSSGDISVGYVRKG
jgi:hypothetical protein